MMNPFQSFFMGGYECADHVNRQGDRVNLLRETAHDRMVREDYRMLATTGISTVREGICWSVVEKQPFMYDFSEVENRISAAEECGIQQIWDICHFGYPDDMMPTHPKFALRFSNLCRSFAVFYRKLTNKPLIVTPINEINFLSWLSGDVRGTVPFAAGMGMDIKVHLCKAAIQGIKALREVDPDCKILLVEPLIYIHPPEGTEMTDEIRAHNESQFQSLEIIGGNMYPELGGDQSYLDILGFNYYYNNQWEHKAQPYHWPDWKEKQVPFHQLLTQAYNRYKRPVILSETGHFGIGRAQWLREITLECILSMGCGTDLLGICLYPIIDRPDWNNLNYYHNSGLVDIDITSKKRTMNSEYLEALQECDLLIKNKSEVPYISG